MGCPKWHCGSDSAALLLRRYCSVVVALQLLLKKKLWDHKHHNAHVPHSVLAILTCKLMQQGLINSNNNFPLPLSQCCKPCERWETSAIVIAAKSTMIVDNCVQLRPSLASWALCRHSQSACEAIYSDPLAPPKILLMHPEFFSHCRPHLHCFLCQLEEL